MYNAANYPDSTIDTFELLGSKVVSVFWNHVYEKSQKLHATGQTKSITDAYKFTAQAYLGYFRNEKLYKKGVTDIYTHFNRYSPVPLLTYSHFVDTVTREFVPTDYWSGLNQSQRDTVLSTALEGVHKKLCEHMIDPRGLQRVIDGHDNRENVTFFQNLAVQILIEEREHFYHKFTKPVVGSTSAVTERLRSDIVKALAQKKQLTEALGKASAEIKAFAAQVEALEKAKAWLIERARVAEQGRAAAVAALEAMRTRVAAGGTTMAPVATSYIPVELQPEEFDPYAELDDAETVIIAPSVETVAAPTVDDELAELEAELDGPEAMKAHAKRRRSQRSNNVKLEPDDLGF